MIVTHKKSYTKKFKVSYKRVII